MFNSDKKKLIDKELELYKREEIVRINEVIQSIKAGSLKQIDEARQDANRRIRSTRGEEAMAIPAAVVEMEMLRAENKFLKETIALFAKNGGKP